MITETYISVDIEASGPNPADHSMLSLGACTIFPPQKTFYIELCPLNGNATPAALAVSGLSLERLQQEGIDPPQAMQRFADWLVKVVPASSRLVFVGLNAPFDWSFVNDYFHRFLGHNPFGHSALDIKALYMGLTGASWQDTYLEALAERCGLDLELSHHALEDALDQAEIFRHLLNELLERGPVPNGSTNKTRNVV